MAPNRDQIYEARSALRRYSAGQVEKVYIAASKSVGDKLQFSSSRHLFTGLVGLMSDGAYTLWEPAKNVLNSEVLKDFAEDKLDIVVPAGQSLLETLVDKVSQGKSPAEKKKMKDDVEKGLEGVRKFEAYQQNLAEYAQQKGKSPYEILKSAKDRMEVIFKSYGPAEEYKRLTGDTTKKLAEAMEQIVMLGVMVEGLEAGSFINELIESKLGNGNLTDIEVLAYAFDRSVGWGRGTSRSRTCDINLDTLGIGTENVNKIAREYIKDVVIFGKAMISESLKLYEKETEAFKKFSDKKLGKTEKTQQPRAI